MTAIRYALIADGTSDKALQPIIGWTLRRLWADGEFAEPSFFPRQHQDLEEKVDEVIRKYRFDLVLVHRDAERESLQERLFEIPIRSGVVPIVPVRMTEAWLLIDERALRAAADNPRGRVPLEMPLPRCLESLSDPKRELHTLLKTASEKTGRRLKKFNVNKAVHRLAEIVEDFEPLTRLEAYTAFESKLREVIKVLKASPGRDTTQY